MCVRVLTDSVLGCDNTVSMEQGIVSMAAFVRRSGYALAVLALALTWGVGEVCLDAFHHHGPDDHEENDCPFTSCLQGHSSELPTCDSPGAAPVFSPDLPLPARVYLPKVAHRSANAVRGPPLGVEATY